MWRRMTNEEHKTLRTLRKELRTRLRAMSDDELIAFAEQHEPVVDYDDSIAHAFHCVPVEVMEKELKLRMNKLRKGKAYEESPAFRQSVYLEAMWRDMSRRHSAAWRVTQEKKLAERAAAAKAIAEAEAASNMTTRH